MRRSQARDRAAPRPASSTAKRSWTTRSSRAGAPGVRPHRRADGQAGHPAARARRRARRRSTRSSSTSEGKIVRGTVHRIEKRNVIVDSARRRRSSPSASRSRGALQPRRPRARLRARRSRRRPRGRRSCSRARIRASWSGSSRPRSRRSRRASCRSRPQRASRASAPRSPSCPPSATSIPSGACVGLRGTRIQVISRELRSEKIDIVEWAPDPATFVARALSPAKVSSVTPRARARQRAGRASVLVIVPDNQLSLAIGKRGQNARLAAKLTGLRVDIKSEGEVEGGAPPRRGGAGPRPAGLAEFPGVGPQLIERLVEHGPLLPGAHRAAGLVRSRGAAGPRRDRRRRRSWPPAQEWMASIRTSSRSLKPPRTVGGRRAPGGGRRRERSRSGRARRLQKRGEDLR